MSRKVAVILSGCGVFDGSEIHEATLVMLRLDEAGVAYQCMAPDIEQMHVINHLNGETMPGQRNVLVESARLCRGNIVDLAHADAADYAAVILPGGFGAAKNLCNFAVAGADMEVNADVARFVGAMHAQGKPVGLICIAPAMAPRLIGKGVQCTIGRDDDPAADAIRAMGGEHRTCAVDRFTIDEKNNVISTPAYMLAGRISDAAAGITRLVTEIVRRM
ncbi:MAG: Glyoxalase ElbB [Pseudomonadales bacterium]|nr:Glyoxalase ElbB [Pseudomonadales bacterium]